MTILEYNLTKKQISLLRKAGIYNGVGWEGENVEGVILQNIKLLPWYDESKAERLLEDIRSLAVEHDIQFYFKMWFYKSNLKFAIKIYKILHWSTGKRISVAIIAFILLNRYGKKFYYSKKSV